MTTIQDAVPQDAIPRPKNAVEWADHYRAQAIGAMIAATEAVGLRTRNTEVGATAQIDAAARIASALILATKEPPAR